jgi:hypothetical protein
MRRISSSATLILKILLPTFWIVFFGAFTIGILSISNDKSPILGGWKLKAGIILFYLVGVTVLYFTVMALKRVELDKDFMYVTNFFKTCRYPYTSIKKIKEWDYSLFRIARIYFQQPGYFGKSIFFLESKQKFEDFVKSFPELSSKLESQV